SVHYYIVVCLLCFFFQCYGDLRALHSFPTRRSSDLSEARSAEGPLGVRTIRGSVSASVAIRPSPGRASPLLSISVNKRGFAAKRDRKSTRLNSSHVAISYAVFCLKKKKKKQITNNNH